MKAIFSFLVKVSLVGAFNYLNYDCESCLVNNGQYCLLDSDFNEGTCCDPAIPFADKTFFCKSQSENVFCATAARITNPYL